MMAKTRSSLRSARATSLIETVVGLILGLPVVVAIIFVIVECCSYFLIQANLDAATRKATRDFSIEWGKDPTVATDGTKQQAVFTDCLIPGFVNDPGQFSAPVFDGSDPPTVTVVGTYAAGQYGLAPFPHPNPLGLNASFTIRSEATYRLE
jgi:hypothetical protein